MSDETAAPPPVVIIFNAKSGSEARAQMVELLGGVSAPAMSGVSYDTGPQQGVQTGAPTPAAEPAKRGRGRPKTETPPADPVPPSGDTETGASTSSNADTAAQDAADEKADTDAQRDPEKPLTIDDVKAAVGEYVAKWTMPVAGLDLQFVFHAATDGKMWKLSQMIGADQSTLKAILDAIRAAVAAEARPKVALDAVMKFNGPDGKLSSQAVFEAWMAANKKAA